jgi:two-component system phosphate regulon sensor histidine kinase PhoR
LAFRSGENGSANDAEHMAIVNAGESVGVMENTGRSGWFWLAAVALIAGGLLASSVPHIGLWLCAAAAVLVAGVGLFYRSRDREERAVATTARIADLSLPKFANAVFEQVPDPLMLLDAGGRALFANKAMRDIVGTDVVRKQVSLLLRTPTILEAIEKTTTTGVPESLEITFRVPVERYYEAHVGRADIGTPVIVVMLHDLTAAKRAEQMRADFVANASHELRTPLAAVSGFIDTLRGHARDDPDARERFLGIMSVEAGRMRRLIEDLLSLTRIELNEHVRPSTRMNLADAVKDAAAALAPLAEQDDMKIEIGSSDGLPEIFGERDEMIQLFQNLIHNAIKYGREGGTVQVTFGTAPSPGGRQADSLIFASVKDDGEGISPAAIPRLTERFYRVDVKRSRERGGTGLGLAIVKHIVNRHLGRLQIESQPGEGSTFTVFLPAAPAVAAAAVT